MPTAVDPTNPGKTREAKRLRKTANVTGVAATGVVTFPAGFLNDLQPGDVLRFTAKTGGSGVALGTDYYLAGKQWAAGATTATLATQANGGSPLALGSDLTAASTVETGKLDATTDGVLSGNHIPQGSPQGGGFPQ